MNVIKYKIDEEEFRRVLEKNVCMTHAALELGIPFSTFVRHAKRLGIYRPNQGKKGAKTPWNKITKEDFISRFLKPNTNWVNFKLKMKLFEFEMIENKCSKCGQNPEWMGKRLPLEHHHKDGDHTNNSIENLEILCPNCHAIL